jgi:GNAT superfamily N-acetyltransferase
MAALSDSGKIIVAKSKNSVIGAAAYIGPHKPKAAFFKPDWTIMRMRVASPLFRGLGVNRNLAEECIQLARRDQAKIVALHSTKLMTVALSMYERMGFKFHQEPEIFGVPYGVYVKELGV